MHVLNGSGPNMKIYIILLYLYIIWAVINFLSNTFIIYKIYIHNNTTLWCENILRKHRDVTVEILVDLQNICLLHNDNKIIKRGPYHLHIVINKNSV